MDKNLMDYKYICLVFIVIVCIDQGDGHWKERDKEKLRHDIELYKTMAEKIEREIESFYDEYPEERYKKDDVDRIQYKRVTNILHRKTGTENPTKSDKVKHSFFYSNTSDITNEIPTTQNAVKHEDLQLYQHKPNKSSPPNLAWPKFEDMLLAMGRKYDWKNDRWIKVKQKLKISNTKQKLNVMGDNNSTEYHEKHKFSYRIVKLNKSKSRRNVVVAVSAVR